MQIIIKKVTLVAAPAPSFVGTRLDLATTADGETFSLRSATLADGSATATLDWGDGTIEDVATISNLTHTYAKAGTYTLTLSDDVAILAVAPSNDATTALLRVICNAQKLTKLSGSCFARCTNLTSVDLGESAIVSLIVQNFAYDTALTSYKLPRGLMTLAGYAFRECVGITEANVPTGVTILNGGTFYGCTGIKGEVRLPGIQTVSGTATTMPFYGCTGITAIHFAAANEATIKASAGYQADPQLGATNATVVFDL